MNNLFKLVLLAGILVFSGCGKEQSGQESMAKTTTMEKPAAQMAPATPAAPATASKESGMEKMEKPAWARLEQNVYHYPQ